MGKTAKSEVAETEIEKEPEISVYDWPHVELEPPGMARLKARMPEYEQDYFEWSRWGQARLSSVQTSVITNTAASLSVAFTTPGLCWDAREGMLS